jgi:hypothetical protein
MAASSRSAESVLAPRQFIGKNREFYRENGNFHRMSVAGVVREAAGGARGINLGK